MLLQQRSKQMERKLSRLRKMATQQELFLRRRRGKYELIFRQPEIALLQGATLKQIEAELKEGLRTDR
jgi:hypothetical protein